MISGGLGSSGGCSAASDIGRDPLIGRARKRLVEWAFGRTRNHVEVYTIRVPILYQSGPIWHHLAA